jgi:hypothetical protein
MNPRFEWLDVMFTNLETGPAKIIMITIEITTARIIISNLAPAAPTASAGDFMLIIPDLMP